MQHTLQGDLTSSGHKRRIHVEHCTQHGFLFVVSCVYDNGKLLEASPASVDFQQGLFGWGQWHFIWKVVIIIDYIALDLLFTSKS